MQKGGSADQSSSLLSLASMIANIINVINKTKINLPSMEHVNRTQLLQQLTQSV